MPLTANAAPPEDPKRPPSADVPVFNAWPKCERCGAPLEHGPDTEDQTGLCPGCLLKDQCET